jgi:hypothetical protein
MHECAPRCLGRLPALLIAGVAIALSLPVRGDSAGKQQLLKNPGFEPPYAAQPLPTGKGQVTGQIASGWEDNSGWADVTVDYSQAAEGAHGGSSAQRITVKEVRSGAVQFAQRFAAERGHIYVLSAWVRGTSGSAATLLFRQAPSPYRAYKEQAIAFDGKWQQVTLKGISADSGDAFFMVAIHDAETVLVADASAVDMTGAVSAAPRIAGNMLPDSSFEAGLGAGWSVRCELASASLSAAFESMDPRPVLDATTAADQKHSVKVDLPGAGSVTISSPLVRYNYGLPHTAGIWLKASVPGASARLELLESTQTRSFQLTSSWQHCALTTVIPYGDFTRLTVTANMPAAGTIWFDAADLRESDQGAPTAGEPPQTELVLHVDRPGGIFFDGEAAIVHVAAANAPEGAVLRAFVLDLYGHTSELKPQPASQEELRIEPDATRPRGMFKVTARLVTASGASVSLPVQQVFARLPHPREIAPEKSYFGVHIPLAPEYFQIAHAIGARWCRIHDASWVTIWPVVEPHPGEFVFYDEGVDAAAKAGIKILGMLDGGPAWASVKPRATSGYFSNYNAVDAPEAEAQWKEYVQKVVSHYKGKIDYWEVWNEPWGETFSPGPSELYGKLLKDAYPIARQANPNAVVVGMDTTGGMDAFTDTALRVCGGSNSYDAFSYHDYYYTLYGGPNSQAARDAATWRAFERKYGQVKPHWVTESAPNNGLHSFYWPVGEEQATRSQLALTVRFDVTLMANGVQHGFYYTLHADPPENAETFWIALDYDRTIRPLLAARAVLASVVDGAESLGRSEPVAGVDCYGFLQTDGKRIDVLWSYDSRSHTIAAPKGAEVLDALGNPIATTGGVELEAEPVYFVR